MSKDEQIQYVSDYLKNKYSVDVSIDDITKKTYGGKFKEDKSTGTAQLSNNNKIHFSVDDNGLIVDDGFLLSMQSQINSYFEIIIDSCINNYSLDVSTEVKLESLYQNKYNNVNQLCSDNDVNFVLKLYIDKTNQLTSSQIELLISNLEKAKIDLYIFYVDNVNHIDNIDLKSRSLYYRLNRK